MILKKIAKPQVPLILSLLATSGCISPIPNYCCERNKHADYDAFQLETNVELPDHPLTLEEVLSIAMLRNLDVQLQRMEENFQSEKIFAQKLRMLPDGTGTADINNRDNNPAWFSRTVNLPGGPGPIGPFATQSTSKWQRTYDLTAAWNLIDFGLSYVRTQQEKNRYLLLRQKNLRARQNMILDIYRAYYRAVVAQQAVAQSKVLIGSLQRRQETLKAQIAEQVVSEMQGLVNENRLLDLQIKLYAFDNEYNSAMAELSALMGVVPGRCFTLAEAIYEEIEVGDICINEFERMALRYRPELLSQEMQFIIDVEEVKASMIEMMPSTRLFASAWHDDDIFMLHHNWFKYGTTLAWNFLQLPAKWANTDTLDARSEISWKTRLTMSMGVITQVHLSYINVQESKAQYGLAKDLFKVKDRQLTVSRTLERGGELSTDDVLVFEVEALFARVNAIKAFSNLQIALEQLGNSIGRPLYLAGENYRGLALDLANTCDFGILSAFDPGLIRRTPTQVFNYSEAKEVVPPPPPKPVRIEGQGSEDYRDSQPQPIKAMDDHSDEELKELEDSYNQYLRDKQKALDEMHQGPETIEQHEAAPPAHKAPEPVAKDRKQFMLPQLSTPSLQDSLNKEQKNIDTQSHMIPLEPVEQKTTTIKKEPSPVEENKGQPSPIRKERTVEELSELEESYEQYLKDKHRSQEELNKVAITDKVQVLDEVPVPPLPEKKTEEKHLKNSLEKEQKSINKQPNT